MDRDCGAIPRGRNFRSNLQTHALHGASTVAMMSWDKLLSNKRLGGSDVALGPGIDSTGRSAFLSDVDRITFSPSFRRLARKTQVFPLAANDHVHNRLTHSLEVSRVGRTLGSSVGWTLFNTAKYERQRPSGRTYLDFGAIVEAASLAHDIGHPAFGHAGDRAIRHWFDHSECARRLRGLLGRADFTDLRNFDGNAQGFRRITQLDKNIFAGGLNLTYATLASYIKYPRWRATPSFKSGFFRTERQIVEVISHELGLTRINNGYVRHPLSYLVEAADDVCYGFLDLEDAVEMGVLELHDVAETLLNALPPRQRKAHRPRRDQRSHRVVFAKMRGKIFREAISAATVTFFQHYEAILAGTFNSELLEEAATQGQRAAQAVLDAKRRARDEVFAYHHKASVELGSYAVTGRLLDEFVRAALAFADAYARNSSDPRVDTKSQALLNMLGDHRPTPGNAPKGCDWTAYQCVRRMVDFISGMTDDFAIRVCRQLSGQLELRA